MSNALTYRNVNIPVTTDTKASSDLFPTHTDSFDAYADDITEHLLHREQFVPRDFEYLRNQLDVTDRMRMILVDWLVDVAIKFKVHPETLFLAIDIVDRYLMKISVSRNHLQLVGITAMLLAAKHEELWAPDIKDCIYISANTYSQNDIINMELSIASELAFRFTVPTAYSFMCILLDRLGVADKVTLNAAMFYLECSALNYSMLEFLPSQIASAASFLGLLTISPDMDWIAHFKGCCFGNFSMECAKMLLTFTTTLLQPSSRFQAIRRKYSSDNYSSIALMNLPENIPALYIQ